MRLTPTGSAVPAPTALEGLDAENINRVLELLVEPLQAALPQPTEVVLHDLQRIPNTVRAIAGPVTGRRVGDPPTDKLLERVAVGDLRHEIGYRSQLPDGRILQSTTIIYTDGQGRAAAALCLNADVSAWVALRAEMDRFVLGHDSTRTPMPATASASSASPMGAEAVQGSEYFAHSVEELSARLVEAAIGAVGIPVDQMRKEHKVQVVAELERRGFFLVKQAAETAASALGVTRFTIYNYLNELGGTVEETA
ncbi:helix-turn-helix transcriptional regulator [Paenarthrobacter ureafaciens]|uniref:helix-turn-helix transcriptional regulator n=1 Tax=Paenarthrobacter ureafaciens TaxID=37931 RepID=UPI00346392BD